MAWLIVLLTGGGSLVCRRLCEACLDKFLCWLVKSPFMCGASIVPISNTDKLILPSCGVTEDEVLLWEGKPLLTHHAFGRQQTSKPWFVALYSHCSCKWQLERAE